ncbi:unnamed protein product [Urochloa humidicola]
MEDATERPPAGYLHDDLIVDILSRLPTKSLCRCMCVSTSWRALLREPAYRHMFARITPWPSFFFLCRRDGILIRDFITAKGDGGLPLVDSALSFLPASTCRKISLLDSCNGLLLRCKPAIAAGATVPPRPAFYIVCNPTTREWVALPQPSLEPGFDSYYRRACSAALGFDPSVSPHFHVFQLEEKELVYKHFVNAVEIYSSETGTWTRKETQWTARKELFMNGHKTYFNGFLHLTMSIHDVIAMVDTRGQATRTIGVPFNGTHGSGFVGHSQGRLVYVDVRTKQVAALAIYVLEDHTGDQWTLRHKVKSAVLFGLGKLPSWLDDNPVVAFHPTCYVFFFYDRKGKRLMSYDMKAKRVHVIGTLENVVDGSYPFFFYVPLYSGTLDGQLSSRCAATISSTNHTS